MTQFKFGDMVRHTAGKCGVVTYIDNNKISVLWAVDLDFDCVLDSELELIPHPDAVRIDWLADKDNHIGSVTLPTECVTRSLRNLTNLRDAIDCAMSLDHAPD